MSDWDAIVVGAGPAGMAAATRLAEGRARVLLVDEQPSPGGQIYRAIETTAARPELMAILGDDYAHGGRLATALRGSGADYAPRTTAWRFDPDGFVHTLSGDDLIRHHAGHIVLATGALERPCPLPGWTLPGVMTVGALQIMLKSSGLRPAGRVVLAGSGPLLYVFAAQCAAAGVAGLSVVDTADPSRLFSAARYLPRALTGEGPRYLRKGVELFAKLRRAGVRLYRNAREVALEGDGKLTSISFAAAGRRLTLDCDLVGLHEGVIPHQQAARSLGLAFYWDDGQVCFTPRLDLYGRSSVGTILVAGDAGGIGGARAAEHSGRLAALAILSDQHRLDRPSFDAESRRERAARAAHLSVRPLLDRLYPPSDGMRLPADETLACRCECVTARQVRDAVRGGASGPNQVKAFLRTGMGPCQGRLCGPTVAALIADESARAMNDVGYYRVRSPLAPVTLGQLAKGPGE